MALLLIAGAIVEGKAPTKANPGIVIVDGHTGKSGKADGRQFLCTLHAASKAGGADDGTFRDGGLAWHATEGGCNVAADALDLPEDVRAAASRVRRSPEEQRQAAVDRARRKALGQ